MTYPKTKRDITLAVLSQLPKDSEYHSIPLETLYFKWWQTGRAGRSLRLTDLGADAFEQAELAYYEFTFEINPKIVSSITPRQFMLMMSKKMQCPYWIGRNFKTVMVVKLYDHQIAMLVNLYGDIFEYLESVT